MTVIINKNDRIYYIVSGICRYYGITKEELGNRYRIPAKVKRKRITIKLLHDFADCRYGDIGMALGGKSGSGIWQSLDIINDDLDTDKELKKEYLAIKDYLKL